MNNVIPIRRTGVDPVALRRKLVELEALEREVRRAELAFVERHVDLRREVS